MSDNNDGSKYLEGNYSTKNPFKAVKEWWEDTEQAQELQNAEEYMEAYMQYLKDKRDEHHYLVDGSVLTCTRCTMKPQTPLDKEFTAPEGSNEVILKVTMQDRYKNGAEQLFATIKDSKKFDNIEPFGNCLNPPDRDDERKALELAGESEELRKLGTCRYLMQLNDEWENLISDVGYQEVTGLDNVSLEEITMEAILFCKHGGFIYPVNSGYIETDVVGEEEPEEKKDLEEPDPSDTQAVKEYMWNFFIDAGFSEYAVAGILGNAFAEAGENLDPEAISPSGYYGLFQCGDKRRDGLIEWGKEYAKELGLPESEWENGWKYVSLQCKYALYEYENDWYVRCLRLENGDIFKGTKENFENAQTPIDAALAWACSFERCKEGKVDFEDGNYIFNALQNRQGREKAAVDIYREFTGN